MCSTFKWLLVARVLAGCDRGEFQLEEEVLIEPRDLLAHSPVTSTATARGHLSIVSLMEAAITVSDNTAANLLLKRTGGPAEVTSFARNLGDQVTRLDRIEPELNMNLFGDARLVAPSWSTKGAFGILYSRHPYPTPVVDATVPAMSHEILVTLGSRSKPDLLLRSSCFWARFDDCSSG